MMYGKNILIPYLLNRRIRSIDYIICSHFDTDHVGRIIKCYGEFKSKKGNNIKTGKR